MEQRLSILTLGVADLEVSRRFYADMLGWTPESDQGSIIFYEMGGYLLALYPHEALADDIPVAHDDPLPAYHGFTLGYCVNSREEVDALFGALKAKGVTIAKEPEDVFWGGYSGYFLDPDGHAWEVAHNPFRRVAEGGRFEALSDPA
jgi:uncharacterized protein